MATAVTNDGSGLSSDSVLLDRLRNYLAENPAVRGSRLGAGYQAWVELFETPFGNYVVKRAHGPFFWRRLGVRALRRERDIYERLRDVQGVPRCFGLLDEKHLVLEHVPGDSFRRRQHELLDRSRFFVRLLDTLKSMHAAGVAHGDLKRKDNLLVGPDERPYLIDFGLAYTSSDRTRRFDRVLFDWVKQYDYNAWIKHKYQRRVDSITPDDARYYRPMKLERLARTIRLVWQKLTFRRYRTRHR